jgi:HEAT repeat protein
MKKLRLTRSIADEKKELRKYGFSRSILSRLYRLIDLKKYSAHVEARNYFIKEGSKILPVLHKLMNSDYKRIRKQAIKIIGRIAHKSSIPVVIGTLEDEESEIRWIAAETLIRIGRDSVKPLLEALVKNGSESYYLRLGAHHVLSELVNDNDPKELKEFVNILSHRSEIPEIVPARALKIISRGL